MSQTLESITGLLVVRKDLNNSKYNPEEAVESEGFQVGLYPPGGFFGPHVDAVSSAGINETQSDLYTSITKEFIGDRLATLMFYLNDVEGGSTVFPWIGKASTPEKGSAAFWFNIYPNGEFDPNSLHAACPIHLWAQMGLQ